MNDWFEQANKELKKNICCVGNYDGATPVIDGANQSGDILKTRGWIANGELVLRYGNRFIIHGVYDVDFIYKVKLPNEKLFIVAEDLIANDTCLELKIFPSLSFDGTNIYDNVSNAPDDGAKIEILGLPREEYYIQLKDIFFKL